MAGRPRPTVPPTFPPRGSAYVAALRLLGRREYSAAEITTRLHDRGYPPGDVQAALARLLADGSLDDRRVALAHVRTASLVKGRGARRIRQELDARGISKTVVTEALAHVSADDDTRAIERFLQRRCAPVDPTPADRRRLFQQLLRRGFSAEVISSTLRQRKHREEG